MLVGMKEDLEATELRLLEVIGKLTRCSNELYRRDFLKRLDIESRKGIETGWTWNAQERDIGRPMDRDSLSFCRLWLTRATS